ncbi:MAG: PQQ-binding-like beta-propeller repeat protein [Bryobacteraceae bacterium]
MSALSTKLILGGCAWLVCFAASGSGADAKAGQTKAGQLTSNPGDWPAYDHDPASTRYSTLKQINTQNVATLKSAWTFSLRGETAPARFGGGGSEETPIVINGIMYITASARVVALEAASGKEVWSYTVTGARPSTRGVAYWPGDKENPPRIIFTAGRNLIALNANTGKLDPGFGKEGIVDMVVGYGGVPTVFRNVVTVGAAVLEVPTGPPGDTRAFDARTGAKLWAFHTVPGPGEVGHETWLNDGWKDRSGTNVWAWPMTADAQRGILYMTIDGPASNYYGGDRPGANLFGNSLVAVDAETGKLKWYFQTVHHDLWDYDNPPAPVLLDITVNGKKIHAIADIGKTGWMFILNRETGKPVFGVEERKVAAGDVPGEWYSPTQPFPLKPPPLARMSYKPEDLVTAEDTTPEHAKACQELVERSGGFYNAGPFTPFLFHADGAPPKSSIIFPGATGGTNWGGMAVDPTVGYIFVYTQDQGQVGWTEKKKPGVEYSFDEHGSPLEYTRAGVDGPGPFHTFTAPVKAGSRETWPCQKPPWGRLTAVNANTGEIAWQVPFGITEALGPDRQNTGRSGGFAGPTATAGGLVFAGIVNDNRFRAMDSKTGKELWSAKLDATAAADPMTYQGKDGKQYVAIVSGLTLNVFALP